MNHEKKPIGDKVKNGRSIITSIQFKDMSFEYEKGHRLFDKLDLEISGCGLYALVGASGSGKSTLFDLLLELQNPVDGQILLNSTEIHEINLKSLHQQIGFVPQDKFFFNRSIYDNIFSKPRHFKRGRSKLHQRVKRCPVFCAYAKWARYSDYGLGQKPLYESESDHLFAKSQLYETIRYFARRNHGKYQ